MASIPDGSIAENLSMAGSIKSGLKSMRGKRSGILFGTILAGGISCIVLFFLPVSILAYLIIAALGFGIPYYFGLKRITYIIVYGLALMVVLSFVFAGAYTHDIYISPTTVSQDTGHNNTTGYYFLQGGVTPVQGSGSTVFTFNVQFHHPSSGPSLVPVYVIAETLFVNGQALNTTMVPVSNQTLSGGGILTTYTYSASLPSSEIFILQFKSNVSGVWVPTTVSIVPRTSTQFNTFTTIIGPSFLVVFLSIATLFFGVALIVLLVKQTRTRRDKILKARMEGAQKREGETDARTKGRQSRTTGEKPLATKKEKFICTSCGAEVGRDDRQCPKCGEKFD